jgi:hypothetical protein
MRQNLCKIDQTGKGRPNVASLVGGLSYASVPLNALVLAGSVVLCHPGIFNSCTGFYKRWLRAADAARL